MTARFQEPLVTSLLCVGWGSSGLKLHDITVLPTHSAGSLSSQRVIVHGFWSEQLLAFPGFSTVKMEIIQLWYQGICARIGHGSDHLPRVCLEKSDHHNNYSTAPPNFATWLGVSPIHFIVLGACVGGISSSLSNKQSFPCVFRVSCWEGISSQSILKLDRVNQESNYEKLPDENSNFTIKFKTFKNAFK